MTEKRKGVSPVIATLLLIVIAVAAAVLTYIWVTGYIGRTTTAAEAPQLQERIKINAVQAAAGTGVTVTISAMNIGDVKVTIKAAYILTEGGTQVCFNTNVGTSSDPGQINDIQVSGCSLSAGTTYVAKIVTVKGTEATFTFTLPP
jgi:flagellin-like protein